MSGTVLPDCLANSVIKTLEDVFDANRIILKRTKNEHIKNLRGLVQLWTPRYRDLGGKQYIGASRDERRTETVSVFRVSDPEKSTITFPFEYFAECLMDGKVFFDFDKILRVSLRYGSFDIVDLVPGESPGEYKIPIDLLFVPSNLFNIGADPRQGVFDVYLDPEDVPTTAKMTLNYIPGFLDNDIRIELYEKQTFPPIEYTSNGYTVRIESNSRCITKYTAEKIKAEAEAEAEAEAGAAKRARHR